MEAQGRCVPMQTRNRIQWQTSVDNLELRRRGCAFVYQTIIWYNIMSGLECASTQACADVCETPTFLFQHERELRSLCL